MNKTYISRRRALRTLAKSAGAAAALSVLPLPARSALPEMLPKLQKAAREQLGDREFLEGRVVLDLPDRANSGVSVPLTVSVPDSPMTAENYVKSLHVMTTRNPQLLVTDYYFTPRSGRAQVSQRIRIAQSQHVFAFAIMSDESAWITAKYVIVTLGACAEEIFIPDQKRAIQRRQ
jgi:sulfur-oxidizing protein SoxY